MAVIVYLAEMQSYHIYILDIFRDFSRKIAQFGWEYIIDILSLKLYMKPCGKVEYPMCNGAMIEGDQQ